MIGVFALACVSEFYDLYHLWQLDGRCLDMNRSALVKI
jgi:hypothetical protein